MQEPISALIISRSDLLRHSLRILLMSVSQLETIRQTDDSHLAISMLAGRQPTLVLLDASLPDEDIDTVLRQGRNNGTRCRTIVFADDIRQQQDALHAGADMVLIKGHSATRLLEAIEKLVSKWVDNDFEIPKSVQVVPGCPAHFTGEN